jgi:hypothetical protein
MLADQSDPVGGIVSQMFRSRWAAIGAAVAVTLGAGGVSLTQAAISSDAKPVYVALDTPCRVVDTRPGDSNVGPRATPIGAGDAAAYTIQITGASGDCTGALAVPSGAVAVATNVTVIAPSGAASGRSFFTIYPAGATRPVTSNLNFVNGQAPTPNKVDVGLSADGTITIYNNEGTAHAAVDVFGYYIDHTHDDRYYTKAQTYTKAEVDGALAGKANTTDVYTKTEVDAATLLATVAPAGPAAAVFRGRGATAVTRLAPGFYSVTFDRDVSGCIWNATYGAPAFAGVDAKFATVRGMNDNPAQVGVVIRGADGDQADGVGFHLIVVCP